MDSNRLVVDLPVEGNLPSLAGALDWLNSPPLTPEGLRGRVVLIDFCTYTCINWIRTLPYIRAWNERYGEHGLVVVGVHTPEFSFEHDLENVRGALRHMRVDYPIAIDSEYAVWDAFANHYWPALYFVDARGRIRHHVFGEGDYERSEIIIRQLLGEAGADEIAGDLVAVDAQGAEAPADWARVKSPEAYLGYQRAHGFESRDVSGPGARRMYAAAPELKRNHWDLAGDWTVDAEGIHLNEPGGRIAYAFHARDVHLVMGPAERDASVPFRVLIDGRRAGAAHGVDVDAASNGEATDQRMYQLIRQPHPITDRRFEIEFLESGLEAFVFTFG